jgi:DNA polymerase-3 subunit alpha
MAFAPLHLHSEYSLLDGAIRFEPLVRRAKELGLPALALTDHGNLHGAVEFWHACRKGGIHPVLGCELYVAPGSRFERAGHGLQDHAHHLVVLARDLTGYKNLLKLSTLGFLQGFYYKPRVDREALKAHSQGLIALSGCLQGEIPSAIRKSALPAARQAALEHLAIFGEGNFFLELQDHGLAEQQEVNRALAELARDTGIPTLATNDSHYLERADAEAHDALLCVQTAASMDDPKRLRFPGSEFYLKGEEEMRRVFAWDPGAVARTAELALSCQWELPGGRLMMPGFTPPESFTPPAGAEPLAAYLESLCQQGLLRRYPEPGPRAKAAPRLEHELKVITQAGFAGYFLIVQDFVAEARRMGVRVGPGRGSAAGSLVSYLLGITALDPLAHGLLFERFLNPERLSPPDIDVDLADTGRDQVIAYVMDRYGRENVAQIATFNTLGARAALRDVGRVLGVPVAEVEALLKAMPEDPGAGLAEARESSRELQALLSRDARLERLWGLAQRLEGLCRNTSVHAAGIVICPEPLVEHVPLGLARGLKGEAEGGEAAMATVTQYPMESLEKLGLIKMDLLGLRTLSVIDRCLALLKDPPDLDRLPDGDSATYAMLGRGEAHGVFQLESSGMRDLLKRFKPKSLSDLTALGALYRPGAMAGIDEFLRRRGGGGEAKAPLPAMDAILAETHGIIVYQEQVMQIAVAVGGLSLAQADLLRRAMSKKDPAAMERQREAFLKGAAARRLDAAKAGEVFDLLAKFGGYGFNKSHSAAYALLSYQTAWLKAHHPLEYLCGLLSSELGSPQRLVASMAECRRMGVPVLPPDVNQGGEGFMPDPAGGIRYSLAAVKHVGLGLAQAVLKARAAAGPFISLDDLLDRMDCRNASPRALESMAKAGALDSLLPGLAPALARPRLLARLPQALEAAARRARERESGQASLFGAEPLAGLVAAGEGPQPPAWHESALLGFEKEALGSYVSGHPLAPFEQELKALRPRSLARLDGLRDGEPVLVAGLVLGLKHLTTKRKEPMARAMLEDLEGMGEVILWPSVLAKAGGRVAKDALVVVKGRADLSGDSAKVSAEEVCQLEEAFDRLASAVHLRLDGHGAEGGGRLAQLRDLARAHPGKVEVYLHMDSGGREVVQKLGPAWRVRLEPALVLALRGLCEDWWVTSAGRP